ncbi:MAG: IclR family transcriptional regulator, partial [Burkholderia sp.]|nr:IclR family transcriptional regulator [Burkholderia sp.]
MSKAAKAAPGKGASGTEIAEGGKTQRGIQSVEVGGRLLLALAQAR